jgi:hypothetical protein
MDANRGIRRTYSLCPATSLFRAPSSALLISRVIANSLSPGCRPDGRRANLMQLPCRRFTRSQHVERMAPLRRRRWGTTLATVGLLLLNVSEAMAQGDRDPHIGYVFPAGAQAGTTVQVTIGGQFLEDVTAVRASGEGIAAADLKFDRPLNNREVNIIQDKIDQAREKLDEQGKKVDIRGRSGAYSEFLALLKDMDVTEDDLRKLQEYRQRDNDPKRQLNPQLEQTVTATLTVAAAATAGRREVRLLTPLRFTSARFRNTPSRSRTTFTRRSRYPVPCPPC